MKRCYSCFSSYDDEYVVCPNCGTLENTKPKEPIYLYPGVVLADRYIIGEAIGQGGFGIIYKAWDKKLETTIAIKEFYVSKLVTRAEGDKKLIISKKSHEEFEYRKKRFLAEARTMAKFGAHKNIPNVFEFVEENNTVYIAMELLDGITLSDYLLQCGGRLDSDFAIMIVEEVGNALKAMHKEKIIHRDVAPDNIFICRGKEIKIKLLDFGAAKLSDETDEYIDIILKPGYSPVEQYDSTKNIGVWSDIYALGATMYYMITGVKPDESTNRKQVDSVIPPNELNPSVSLELSNSIMRAMAIERHLRFRSVDEFGKAIHSEIKVRTVEEEKKRRKTKRFASVVAACLVVAIVSGLLAFLWEEKSETLKDATISVWFSVAEGSTEEAAMAEITKDFEKKFPNVKLEMKVFPEDEYMDAIAAADSDNDLPTLFESTGLSENLIEKARDLDNIMGSDQFAECMFLDKYNDYYSSKKQMPLGIVVPVAHIINNGPVYVIYSDVYFEDIKDFNSKYPIAIDDKYSDLLIDNFGNGNYKSRNAFLKAKSPIYLTTTMSIYDKAIREKLREYPQSFVYPKSEEIYCAFTYEWSIGGGNEAEIAAAEKLLSWMLGNVYQSRLMSSGAHDGQIPINRECFEKKIKDDGKFTPIGEIYKNFIFKENR